MTAQRQAEDDPRAREVGGRRGPGERAGPGRPRASAGPGRGGPRGGRLGRRSTGRFADKAGGHAESVTIGGGADEDTEEESVSAKEEPAGGGKNVGRAPRPRDDEGDSDEE
jgi:hypothetical protein